MMIEGIILIFIVMTMMARKKPYRRRRFNLRQVRIISSSAVTALAALDVVTSAITAVSVNRYRLVSVNLSYQLVDLGAVIDDGQEFGLAHSAYTAAQVEECLEATTAIDQGDKIAQERANRLVRSIGIFGGAPQADGSLTFNDGRRRRTKLNWLMGIGDTLNLWVRNGSGTIYTIGASVIVSGDLWLNDKA